MADLKTIDAQFDSSHPKTAISAPVSSHLKTHSTTPAPKTVPVW
jgi:hypothetical protein